MMRDGRIVYERQSSALWDSDEAAALISRLAAEVPPPQGAP